MTLVRLTYRMILRATRPPITSSAPAPSANRRGATRRWELGRGQPQEQEPWLQQQPWRVAVGLAAGLGAVQEPV